MNPGKRPRILKVKRCQPRMGKRRAQKGNTKPLPGINVIGKAACTPQQPLILEAKRWLANFQFH